MKNYDGKQASILIELCLTDAQLNFLDQLGNDTDRTAYLADKIPGVTNCRLRANNSPVDTFFDDVNNDVDTFFSNLKTRTR